MNTIVLVFIDIVMFLTMWLFVCDKVKFEEIRRRRYNNDKGYTAKLNNWDSAVFLNEQAQNRANLLQAKLSSLLSILSILVGLYSITGAITNSFPVWIQITCLLLAFLGLIYSIGPLTISKINVVDLDKYVDTNNFNSDVQDTFQKSITDLSCRSDFHADCLRIAKSTIFISMIFYIVGIVFALSHPAKSESGISKTSSEQISKQIDSSLNSNVVDTLSSKSNLFGHDSLAGKSLGKAAPSLILRSGANKKKNAGAANQKSKQNAAAEMH